jgi:hypothetical protein
VNDPEAVAWLEDQIELGEPGPVSGFGIPDFAATLREALGIDQGEYDPVEGHGTGEMIGLVAMMERQPDPTVVRLVDHERLQRERLLLLEDFDIEIEGVFDPNVFRGVSNDQ